MYQFEKLTVWHDARILAKMIYSATQSYPKSEIFGLSSQLRRASISVSSNLVEGSGRKFPKDQSRFYEIAYASLLEVLNQLIVSVDLGFLPEEELPKLRQQIEQISSKLSKLRSYNKNRAKPS